MLLRRSYERYPAGVWTSLAVNEEAKKVFLRDLSCRGAGIRHDFSLDLNGRVIITIHEPFSSEPLVRGAKVAWSNKLKIGLWQSGLDFGVDNMIDITKPARWF